MINLGYISANKSFNVNLMNFSVHNSKKNISLSLAKYIDAKVFFECLHFVIDIITLFFYLF